MPSPACTERYAALLPAGPARDRAAATARSLALMTRFATAADRERRLLALSPALEFHDRRRVIGVDPGAADDRHAGVRTYLDLGTDLVVRYDDLLRVAPDAVVLRATYSGRDRRNDAVFAMPTVMVWVFGADGLLTRWEGFDPDCAAEALARFDELTEPTPPPPSPARPAPRRLRPNAAGALAARFAAAFATGDADGVAALWTDDLEVVDHPNAASYGRDGHLGSIRRLQRARAPKLTFVPLATLGDALCLTRRRIATQGTVGGRFDVGASEHEALVLFEVAARGACRRVEVFAVGHLNDAVVRLYERHAELRPAGAAAATAGSIATVLAATLLDVEGYAAALSPAIAWIDHRTAGVPPGGGREEALRTVRALQELATGVTMIGQDILGLESDVLLLRSLLAGTGRASGGAFEMASINLHAFDSDGRLVRFELFEIERSADALARFAELAASD